MAHALFAPSASHRWIECPASLVGEVVEQASSFYATEGTVAHEVAAACLADGLDAHEYAPLLDRVEREGHFITIDEAFRSAVQVYLDFVREARKDSTAALLIEQSLDLSWIHPEMYGTGDALLVDVVNAKLTVIDLKFGRGKRVTAKDNPQLKCYALGALGQHNTFGVDEVEVVIVQPRIEGGITRASYSVPELMDFADTLTKATARVGAAMRLHADREDINAYFKAGDHCGFCAKIATCPALRAHANEQAKLMFKPVGDLAERELAAALGEADLLDAWIGAIRKEALDRAMCGKEVPGYKLVAKRATRQWKEEPHLQAVVLGKFEELGLAPAAALTEPTLKSPPQIEKVVGKKNFAEAFSEVVESRSSGLALVSVEDPRQAVNPAEAGKTMFDVIAN